MAKNIVSRVDRNLARRLREARREVGMSTRAVAQNLPGKLAVSHTTIASYEKGVTVPPINVLAALADLYNRPLNWFLENRTTLDSFRYRNMRSRVRLADQRQFQAVAGKWAEAYFNLDKHLKGHPSHHFNAMRVEEDLEPDLLASTVRENFLNLDDGQPIQSMVHVLESFSAWAFEVKVTFGIDGAAARHGNEFVVVLNPDVANERARMNVAYELAHVLYDDCRQRLSWTDAEVETRAYTFASSLLVPPSQLKAAFDGKSFLKLIQYKEKFGISLAAMIYMAEKERIIKTTTSRWLWTELIRRGWRQNEPGYVWRDRAINFETMLESAIHTKKITWADAERITGIREDELRQRIDGVLQIAESSDDEDQPVNSFKLALHLESRQSTKDEGGQEGKD